MSKTEILFSLSGSKKGKISRSFSGLTKQKNVIDLLSGLIGVNIGGVGTHPPGPYGTRIMLILMGAEKKVSPLGVRPLWGKWG